ncbi:hypothetical protein [Bosea sp. BIWAKO-01]|uniref:hypothetical protein n=1 Tax=Bosea sp. BIWAKO-01 TaxID=506668 RepID=UPI00086BF905|nr:hypothetical protein [Bosea sp. BIWAKO-01]GAU87081.1 hypothetical protein BIWAKO_07034 [Bosea sp. BIWAKO-01]
MRSAWCGGTKKSPDLDDVVIQVGAGQQCQHDEAADSGMGDQRLSSVTKAGTPLAGR